MKDWSSARKLPASWVFLQTLTHWVLQYSGAKTQDFWRLRECHGSLPAWQDHKVPLQPPPKSTTNASQPVQKAAAAFQSLHTGSCQELANTPEAAGAHHISSYVPCHYFTPDAHQDDLQWQSRGLLRAFPACDRCVVRGEIRSLTPPLSIEERPACHPPAAVTDAAGVFQHQEWSPAEGWSNTRGAPLTIPFAAVPLHLRTASVGLLSPVLDGRVTRLRTDHRAGDTGASHHSTLNRNSGVVPLSLACFPGWSHSDGRGSLGVHAWSRYLSHSLFPYSYHGLSSLRPKGQGAVAKPWIWISPYFSSPPSLMFLPAPSLSTYVETSGPTKNGALANAWLMKVRWCSRVSAGASHY